MEAFKIAAKPLFSHRTWLLTHADGTARPEGGARGPQVHPGRQVDVLLVPRDAQGVEEAADRGADVVAVRPLQVGGTLVTAAAAVAVPVVVVLNVRPAVFSRLTWSVAKKKCTGTPHLRNTTSFNLMSFPFLQVGLSTERAPSYPLDS